MSFDQSYSSEKDGESRETKNSEVELSVIGQANLKLSATANAWVLCVSIVSALAFPLLAEALAARHSQASKETATEA
jgi:hypothetical protein